MIRVWKEQVKEQEEDRKAIFEQALHEQRRKEEALLEAHVLGTQLKDKLYKISMESPDAWRELKRFEYQEMEEDTKRRAEEDRRLLEQGSMRESHDKDDEALDDLEAEMKYDATKAATKSILKRDKSGIISQKDAAAKKIGRAAKVKFELGQKRQPEGDSLADEYLDLLNKQSKLNDKHRQAKVSL
jgi:hypothetical protein